MAKLRHVALIVEDPEASAKFFEQAFDMTRAGRRGIYMSDGVINVALLKKSEKERLHLSFRMWVDDLVLAEKRSSTPHGVYSCGALRPRPIVL